MAGMSTPLGGVYRGGGDWVRWATERTEENVARCLE